MGKKIKQKSIIMLTFLLGIILSIHMKSLNPSNTFVSLKSVKEMENQITLERIELENINKLITARKHDIASYELELKENGSINSVMENELKDLRITTGFESIKGSGIIVKLSDSERELEDVENVDYLLVHDSDVLKIVNDLKIAGAEAIAINGERVISLSEMKCAGPTITINGSTYGQPFVIMAMGNQKNLEAAIKAPYAYANLRKLMDGINIDVSLEDEMVIPKYNRKINFKYIKEGD